MPIKLEKDTIQGSLKLLATSSGTSQTSDVTLSWNATTKPLMILFRMKNVSGGGGFRPEMTVNGNTDAAYNSRVQDDLTIGALANQSVGFLPVGDNHIANGNSCELTFWMNPVSNGTNELRAYNIGVVQGPSTSNAGRFIRGLFRYHGTGTDTSISSIEFGETSNKDFDYTVTVYEIQE